MSEPSIPPIPESPVPPAKKGLPVIAWVGIGCGGLIVLGVLVLVILGVVFGKMFGDVAAEMEKNPAKASMMIAAKVEPDIEIIGSDDEKQTVTIKLKSTGETATLSLDDIENGKLPGKLSGESNSSEN